MRKVLLSGDEAVARGAWEAGVSFGSGYPGTPSTEILEAFSRYEGPYSEWSINEKVALEAATGASLGGARALVTMKHVGLNVAFDAFVTLAYTGINAGLVVVSADDPGMHSSQNEQDNRYLGKFSYVPVIEPSDSQETVEFIKKAFEISERFDLPVLFRITTRLAHGKSPVNIDESLKFSPVKKAPSVPWEKYTMMPLNAKKRRVVLVNKQPELKKFSEETDLNREEPGERDMVFITSGVAYNYVKEVFPGKAVFKIGMLNPLPVERIRKFCENAGAVYVVEELEPYIEDILKAEGIKVEGKSKVPLIGELSPDILREAFYDKKEPCNEIPVSPRPPSLCADCGHRGVFKVLSELKITVMGDIGCYTLGALPPFSALQTCIDMGSAPSHAHGFVKAGNSRETVVSVIGDSTFMHSGLQAAASMIYNGADALTIIVDNLTTAMTGRQPHPGAGNSLSGGGKNISVEKVLEALGAVSVDVIDPFKVNELKELIIKRLKEKGANFIIARRPCALLK